MTGENQEILQKPIGIKETLRFSVRKKTAKSVTLNRMNRLKGLVHYSLEENSVHSLMIPEEKTMGIASASHVDEVLGLTIEYAPIVVQDSKF